jgi:hypothetical protein
MKKLVYVLALAAALCVHVSAQSSAGYSQEDLQKYVPVLLSVKAQFWKIDPKLGYAVKSVGGGVYVISDNMWQSAFLVTDEGVIVFDAPASFGRNIPSALSKVTDRPIKMLVYSHVHKDHIGGSAAFKDVKDLKIVALDTVSDFLIDVERLRPIRPVQEVRIVTNTPVGVFRAIVILPSRLRVAVVHRLLRQTSTCSGSRAQAMNLRLRIMPGSPANRKLEDSFGASRFPPDHRIMAHPNGILP